MVKIKITECLGNNIPLDKIVFSKNLLERPLIGECIAIKSNRYYRYKVKEVHWLSVDLLKYILELVPSDSLILLEQVAYTEGYAFVKSGVKISVIAGAASDGMNTLEL